VLGLLGMLALIGARVPLQDPPCFRRALTLAGVGYGVLHFALQRKGWEYHLYPLAAFLCAAAPAAFANIGERAAPGRGVAGLRRPVALAALAITVVGLGVKGAAALEPEWIASKARRVEAVTRDLARLVPAGGTVQVLDTTEGGIHALLRLGLRQPTRYLYDFPLFHDVGDPRIERLRRDFASRLELHPPAAIVVFRDTWHRPGYERLREFPAVEELLSRRYALTVDGGEYRIYAKRSDP
jgi:hypothetical protein